MTVHKFIDINDLKLVWNKVDSSFTTTNAKIAELTKDIAALKEQIDKMTPPPTNT